MARDSIHDAVKQALIHDGWTITADPFHLKFEEFNLFADLAAERSPIAVERQGEKLLIEVKSFTGLSFVRELQQALGQYEMYWHFMQAVLPEHRLFMAVSDLMYVRYFEQNAVQYLLQKLQVAVIVVDLDKETIVQWIQWQDTEH
ncbi:MAG: element excision factor XisH family protein [Caldilineaceae bacterium]